MRASTVSIVILSALALLAPAAQAAAPKTVASCQAARVDKAAAVARTLSDCGKVDLGRGAEGAARQAVGRLSGALGVRRDTSDLGLMRADKTAAGPRLRFQQFVKGVPVHNGQVAVALDTDGSVIQVGNSASTDRTLDTTARVSRAQALLTASRRVPSGDDTVAAPKTSLVAEPTAHRLELAWLVLLPVRAPRGDWNVVVSARTGEVLQAYDSLTRINGSAVTYSPNPVQQTGNTALTDGADADSAALTSARVSLGLTDLDAGTNLLRGTYVDAAPASGVTGCTLPYVPGQASSASRAYNFTRSEDAFEETVAYAAITRVQRDYVAFGFPGIFAAPMKIDNHCITADNSFYSTTDNALHMGDGGVDDAEDADVTIHEFGHATQHNQLPGFGPGGPNTEQRAMGEGFGDFLAAFTYLQDGNANYQATRRFCVAEWDAVSYNPVTSGNPGGGCLRWVDGTDEDDGSDIGTYPGTPVEEHNDGRFWSATLTCVFNGLEPQIGTAQARDDMLTLVLAHHFDLTPTPANTAFADALAALRAEDDAIFDGEDIALINDCGEQRLGKTAPADTTPPVVDGALSPPAPDGANGWYRTAPAVTWEWSDAESTRVHSGCEEGTDPADTVGKTVTCSVTSEGGNTTKQLSYKKDSTAPGLAAVLSSTAPKLGDAVTATPNATDATSGVASQSCAAPDTSTAGPHTVTCTATDAAGNAATQTLAYTVAANTTATYRVTKVKVARNGNLSFRIKASRSGRVRLSAKATQVKFKSANKRLTANKTVKVTLKLSKKARAAFLKKLRGGKKVKVKLTITPTTGKKKTLTFRVRKR